MSEEPNIFHAPWEADDNYVYDAYSVTVARVGTASRTNSDAAEIARLIAAAPEMLKTLETIAAFAPGNGDACEIIAKRARAAIAMATATGIVQKSSK
jgi:hypothetical protein